MDKIKAEPQIFNWRKSDDFPSAASPIAMVPPVGPKGSEGRCGKKSWKFQTNILVDPDFLSTFPGRQQPGGWLGTIEEVVATFILEVNRYGMAPQISTQSPRIKIEPWGQVNHKIS